MPVKAPAAVVAERYNWTGVYLGGNAGYGWSRLTGTDLTFGGTTSSTVRGFVRGRPRSAPILLRWAPSFSGIQGDYDYADLKRNANLAGAGFAPGAFATFKQDFVATLTGRVGFAFDRVLVYAKGGSAWTRDKLNAADGLGGAANGSFSRTGWTVGGGAEWALVGNWSVFAEYAYLNFGSITEIPTVNPGPGAFAVSSTERQGYNPDREGWRQLPLLSERKGPATVGLFACARAPADDMKLARRGATTRSQPPVPPQRSGGRAVGRS